MQCVNIAGCRCWVWFHSTHPAPWWKWSNATGYLSIRGGQEHPLIVPACAPLQIDFLQQAHAHATTPQMPPWTVQWNQLYCTNLLSHQISIEHVLGWHGANCSRGPPLNTAVSDTEAKALMKLCASWKQTGGQSLRFEGVANSASHRAHSRTEQTPWAYLTSQPSTAYITPSPFG